MDNLFDMRPDCPGFRLHRLEVFNWGTFDSTGGQVFHFEPEGRTSLLVGHNGSGKSTLVDAILTLLVDSRSRNYNVAAGAKKTERTPRSYIRGAYDRTSDDAQANVVKYLRPTGSHLTAISAVFRDEQLNKSFTLLLVLFLKPDGSDDKIYAIVDEARQLKIDLAGSHKSNEIHDHLKRLGYQTTKTYVEYYGWLTKRTGMRGKAIDMFNQTVAVKDIQSLNGFIRRHMLEAHDWREKVDRLLTHFNDLSVAHQELVRARKAAELLAPVEKLGEKYRRLDDELSQLRSELDAAETYFPLQIVRLFEPEIEAQRRELDDMVATIGRLDTDLRQASETIRQLKNEIDQAGGERLKQIPGLIELQESHLKGKRATFTRFHDHLKTCGIDDVIAAGPAFSNVRAQLRDVAAHCEGEVEALSVQHAEAIGQARDVQRQLASEREELEILQQRRTNLPGRFTAMRSRICEDLQLDETDLPFAAELIAVLPDERRWEASAEMVLRSFALTLLVPQRFYPRVRAYVDTNRITDARGQGQRLDYFCIGKSSENVGDRIDPRSLFRKLHFKPRHDLTPWVRGEIQRRFDFRCCESVEEFNEVPRLAITENRHVKFNEQRHQKDDRAQTADPRYFVLGWDNTEKKRRIAAHIEQLAADEAKLNDAVAQCNRQLESLRHRARAAAEALDVADFDAIDVNRHLHEINALKSEIKQLREANDVVKALEQRLQATLKIEEELSSNRDELKEHQGALKKDILHVEAMVDSARSEVQSARTAGRFAQHERMFEGITASLGTPSLTTADLFQRRKAWEDASRKRVGNLNEPLRDAGEKLVKAMSRFLGEFKEEQADLDASVQSLDSFLGLLEQLRQEDLPRHEKKFKDRLNDQVTQEVALFNTELREERKQIEGKIGQLNEALAQVEYNRGTFMRLEPRAVKDREIDDFRRQLRECLDESLEHTDAANEARFLRIQKLVERLGDKERTTWRDKVIDVRNWYDFAAREVERETQALRSCYDGSSGQSGGEKAKLAFTILVAALAYQFDIDPAGGAAGRFQFVVVDEMFSKVDDQNAEYALKLFQQFGLQLLIVAPLDAKARITEPFVDRYLHVVKDAATNHSQLFSMTAREFEEVAQQFATNGKAKRKRPAAAK